jgi:hypothetical protein
VTNIIRSLIEDARALLPAVALLVVAYMVLRTWLKTGRLAPTVGAVVVGVLVVGFLADTGGFATLVFDELKSRSGP